ncbi:MAG: DUF177 domain-containing protein [Gammaproteobacteria bacterium]|nr:DUF177 domain-containing protein [Gammaproteobacteria bacterium]
MSESLPITVNPWLLYRRNETVQGAISMNELPNLMASQSGRHDDASAKLKVNQREDGHFVILGEAQATVDLTCQRCLKSLTESLYAEFELVLVKYERHLSSVGEEDDAIVCAEDLELAPIVEQELILSLPMIAKHSDCQAAYTNEVDENADKQQPFANLKDLLK